MPYDVGLSLFYVLYEVGEVMLGKRNFITVKIKIINARIKPITNTSIKGKGKREEKADNAADNGG